ncbi:MAG: hypothetical protein IKO36_04240 [Bacteroidaceae bacterium]|nr:hypothetical protein [Bacteroidaceae bacterium]
MFTDEIITKLTNSFNSSNGMDKNANVVVKIRNVAGPGVFYAISGWYEHKDILNNGPADFYVYGLTNINFSGEDNAILDNPEFTAITIEDFDTFNIPYGHVKFEMYEYTGTVEDAINELNA